MESVSRRHEPMVPWGWRQVLAGVVLSLAALGLVVLVSVVAGVIISLGEPGRDALPKSLATAIALAGTGVLGVVWVLVTWRLGPARYRLSFASAFGLKLPSDTRAFVMSAVALAGSLAFNVAYGLAVKAAGQDRFLPEALDLGLAGPWWIAGIAMIVLWGPFTEELFFRGFVFAGLVGHWGAVGAAAASALVFGLFHGALGVIIPAFVAGLLFAWVYYRTRSLWVCFLAHAAQNALALSVMKGT